MPRSYRHIKEYKKEILELKGKGVTKREIGEKLGFTYEQVHNFISRNNAKDLPLAEKIRECQDKCGRTYGYRRVHI